MLRSLEKIEKSSEKGLWLVLLVSGRGVDRSRVTNLRIICLAASLFLSALVRSSRRVSWVTSVLGASSFELGGGRESSWLVEGRDDSVRFSFVGILVSIVDLGYLLLNQNYLLPL